MPIFQLLLDPDFLKSAEDGLRKYTLIVLRKLCENSMLYPQSYVLKGIENLSHQNSEGGLCDIYQGRYKGQALCLKVVRLYQKTKADVILKVRDHIPFVNDCDGNPNVSITRYMPGKQSYGVNSTIPTSHHFTAFSTLMRHSNVSASYPLGWKMEILWHT